MLGLGMGHDSMKAEFSENWTTAWITVIGKERPQGCFADSGFIVSIPFRNCNVMLTNKNGDIHGLFLNGWTLK